MKTKLVPLLVVCFALLISHVAFAQYTGGSYDGYAVGTSGSDISLPVELSSFTASISGDSVLLKWRTQTEIGNVGFAIYRSESEDGEYKRISFVSGAGSSAMPTDYDFTDKSAESGKIYYYYIEDVDIWGERNKSEIIKVVFHEKAVAIPKETLLLQNFPNPFNPETWIPYQLKESADVTIRIYNISAQLVRKIKLGKVSAGMYIDKDKAVYWDGRNSSGERVSSGLYFYQLQSGEYKDTKRMLILK